MCSTYSSVSEFADEMLLEYKNQYMSQIRKGDTKPNTDQNQLFRKQICRDTREKFETLAQYGCTLTYKTTSNSNLHVIWRFCLVDINSTFILKCSLACTV